MTDEPLNSMELAALGIDDELAAHCAKLAEMSEEELAAYVLAHAEHKEHVLHRHFDLESKAKALALKQHGVRDLTREEVRELDGGIPEGTRRLIMIGDSVYALVKDGSTIHLGDFPEMPALPSPKQSNGEGVVETTPTDDEPKRRGRGRAQKTLDIIKASLEILEEVQPATVRGVCYRLFVRGLIANMSVGETQKISRILTQARERGEVPWHWIVDETRQREWIPQWRDLDQFGATIPGRYRRDFWAVQAETIEVWSEKGTVRGTLQPVLDEFGVTFSCKHGFDSATSVNETAELTKGLERPLIALYVGDWDPSGLCMSESDLPRRLREYGAKVELRRIALTKEDTESGIPSFDAATKSKDGRHKWFVRNYGEKCWELDALDPRTLREKVRNAILDLIDQDAWERCRQQQADDKRRLATTDWTRVFSDQRTNAPRPKPPRPLERKPSWLTPRSGLFLDQRKNMGGGR